MVICSDGTNRRGQPRLKQNVSPFLSAVNAAWPARWSIFRGICAILGKPGKKGLALYAARDKNGETSDSD